MVGFKFYSLVFVLLAGVLGTVIFGLKIYQNSAFNTQQNLKLAATVSLASSTVDVNQGTASLVNVVTNKPTAKKSSKHSKTAPASDLTVTSPVPVPIKSAPIVVETKPIPSPAPAPAPVTPTPPPPPPNPPPPPAPPGSPPSNVSHIVISEIQLTGGSGKTTNDFIELYNPTDAAMDISGWKLRKRTQSGSESSVRVFPDGSSIPTHGFFLWANSDNNFDASINADVSSTASIADNSSIALEDSTGAVIDSVAWGSDLINPFGETLSIATTLEANQSYERKAWQDSCVSAQNSGELLGNGCDEGNNSTDFELRSVSLPQNSHVTTEPL